MPQQCHALAVSGAGRPTLSLMLASACSTQPGLLFTNPSRRSSVKCNPKRESTFPGEKGEGMSE